MQKNLRGKFLYLLSGLLIYWINPLVEHSFASTMSNDSFIIQEGNLDSFAGISSGNGIKLNQTGGETAPGLIKGNNYTLRSGFQYVNSIIRFSFSLSNTVIDFGTLSPTNPVTRAHLITISNGSAFGYQVSAYEDHELKTDTDIIPNTACDSGTCNSTVPSSWTNTLTYGFGYRCDNITGKDCAPGFIGDSSLFKTFANAANNETPQPVMIGTTASKYRQSTITYKVNVSATQPGGDYTNQIIYVATPTF